jgi:hypothetical protein
VHDNSLQTKLDEYWARHKTHQEIGDLYERYVGYLYESDGWHVDYTGIKRRYSDRGRDLIVSKDKKVLIVQCKDFSRHKTIFEKHIFQLFGTAYNYAQIHPKQEVVAVFFTATSLSDFARLVAKKLNVEVHENKTLTHFPIIKCNVSKFDGSKIYYLPFDREYDSISIDEKAGERFVTTILEAEKHGFRHTFQK